MTEYFRKFRKMFHSPGIAAVVRWSEGVRAGVLLSGAPILLLDEATSALDEKTEAKLLKNISEMRDKTCIIVTHRRAALEICDYTLHIADGRMTMESGQRPGE